MSDMATMGLPVYMECEVTDIKIGNEYSTVYCTCGRLGTFSFITNGDLPELGTEVEVHLKWSDKEMEGL